MPGERDSARPGTQSHKWRRPSPWPWVPEIALTRNSGMTSSQNGRSPQMVTRWP
jgi:hypothetical protein